MIQLTDKVNELITQIKDLSLEEFKELTDFLDKTIEDFNNAAGILNQPPRFPVCWNCDSLGTIIKELREGIIYLKRELKYARYAQLQELSRLNSKCRRKDREKLKQEKKHLKTELDDTLKECHKLTERLKIKEVRIERLTFDNDGLERTYLSDAIEIKELLEKVKGLETTRNGLQDSIDQVAKERDIFLREVFDLNNSKLAVRREVDQLLTDKEQLVIAIDSLTRQSCATIGSLKDTLKLKEEKIKELEQSNAELDKIIGNFPSQLDFEEGD